MTAPAAIRTYDDYVEILRARAVALETTRLQIDEVAGLASGYSSKVLAKIRNAGPTAFDNLNAALGLMFIPVEDPDAMDKIRGRYVCIHETRPAEKQEYGDGLKFENPGPVLSLTRPAET